MRDGKPGEVWRVTEPSVGDLPDSWADWLILDGEALETAHALGYKGDCTICLRVGGGGRESTIEIDPEEMWGLTTVDSLLKLAGESKWQKDSP